MKHAIATAVLCLALVSHAAADQLTGDGPGCIDKARGARLAELTDTNAEYISIWATGMQDQSCRGYSAGQEVTVEARDDGLACVKAAEDAKCFWVKGSMAQ